MFSTRRGKEVDRWSRWRYKGEGNNIAPVEILLLVGFHRTGVVFFLSLFMSVIISLSAWKEAWTIAGGLVLRASTSGGPDENKARIANLIIISHLFRELMWCLRCQAVLFLSHSALLLTSLIPLPSSLSYSHLVLSLCFVPEISPHSRGFDESLSRQNMSVWNVILRSGVSETRHVI